MAPLRPLSADMHAAAVRRLATHLAHSHTVVGPHAQTRPPAPPMAAPPRPRRPSVGDGCSSLPPFVGEHLPQPCCLALHPCPSACPRAYLMISDDCSSLRPRCRGHSFHSPRGSRRALVSTFHSLLRASALVRSRHPLECPARPRPTPPLHEAAPRCAALSATQLPPPACAHARTRHTSRLPTKPFDETV